MAPSTASSFNHSQQPSAWFAPRRRAALGHLAYNVFVWLLLGLYLLPLAFMGVTALMSTEQLSDKESPLYPARPVSYNYQGKDYPLLRVPTASGEMHWALVNRYRKYSEFVDPQNPSGGLITWQGNWRLLHPVYELAFAWSNFTILVTNLPFASMLRTTLVLTLVGEFGVLLSSIIVAYGFARFPLPGGDLFFYILIATILIPDKITFIPTYFFFVNYLHWRGTVYPLLLPWFFGGAVYIFLLRQNFKSLPIELEEFAMLDGAGTLRRLFSIVLPQSWPVVITVSLLHFFYTWNETRLASIYLNTNRDLMPLSFGIQNYQSRLPIQNVIEASTIVVLVVPVIVLFLAQRYFMQGMIITGLEK